MTPSPTSPVAESETGTEERARLIAEHAGIDMLDDHDLFIAEMVAALRKSAASAREKALGDAEGIVRQAAKEEHVFQVARQELTWAADAIAALRSSQQPGHGEPVTGDTPSAAEFDALIARYAPHPDPAEEIARLKNRLDSRMDAYLVEMKPNYDDSITGFNEAWDIMRKAFDDAIVVLGGSSPDRGEGLKS